METRFNKARFFINTGPKSLFQRIEMKMKSIIQLII